MRNKYDKDYCASAEIMGSSVQRALDLKMDTHTIS